MLKVIPTSADECKRFLSIVDLEKPRSEGRISMCSRVGARVTFLLLVGSFLLSGSVGSEEAYHYADISILSSSQKHRGFRVQIVGEVLRPGYYTLPFHKTKVRDVVKLAGGPKPNADISHLILQRSIKREDLFNSIKADADAKLQDGDIIVIPSMN